MQFDRKQNFIKILSRKLTWTYQSIKWMAMDTFANLFGMFWIWFAIFVGELSVWWIKRPNIWSEHYWYVVFNLSFVYVSFFKPPKWSRWVILHNTNAFTFVNKIFVLHLFLNRKFINKSEIVENIEPLTNALFITTVLQLFDACSFNSKCLQPTELQVSLTVLSNGALVHVLTGYNKILRSLSRLFWHIHHHSNWRRGKKRRITAI